MANPSSLRFLRIHTAHCDCCCSMTIHLSKPVYFTPKLTFNLISTRKQSFSRILQAVRFYLSFPMLTATLKPLFFPSAIMLFLYCFASFNTRPFTCCLCYSSLTFLFALTDFFLHLQFLSLFCDSWVFISSHSNYAFLFSYFSLVLVARASRNMRFK